MDKHDYCAEFAPVFLRKILTRNEDYKPQRCIRDFGHIGDHRSESGVIWSRQDNNSPVTPTYYQGDYVMRIIEDFKLDFLRGTVVKYLLRAGNKVSDKNAISSRAADTELVDLEKAAWYLDRKIQQLKKEK